MTDGASSPDSGDRRQGARKDGRPVNRTVLHMTHMLVGCAIGFFVAGNAFYLLQWHHGRGDSIVRHLWWVVMVATVVEMFLLREAMDAIRETVFIERRDGQTVETRKRRRHEVVMALVKRATIAFVLVSLLLFGLYQLGLAYAAQLGWLAPLFSGRGLPPWIHHVLLVVYGLVIGAVILVICESTLRSTQKRGFPWQVICLFIPAALGAALACQLMARLGG